MDIWEIAKKMELEGETFYKEMADKSVNPEIAGVFNFMARQEKEHYEFFDRQSKNLTVDYVSSGDPLVIAKNAFSAIAENVKTSDSMTEALDAYRKASEFEEKAVKFYETLLDNVESDQEKTVIQLLIDEEKKHVKIINGLIDFIDSPREWLDSAEFSNF